MCEGSNELTVVKLLMKHNRFRYPADDLLNLTPYHARQIEKNTAVKTALNLYPGEVKILRVGDALNENFKIPKDVREKIIGVEKYCTKPELEMLLIIAEGFVQEFEKVKSSVKPKLFAKQHIKCGRKSYDNSDQFYIDYFDHNIDLLVESIKAYKRIKGKHNKDEGYLADLLK